MREVGVTDTRQSEREDVSQGHTDTWPVASRVRREPERDLGQILVLAHLRAPPCGETLIRDSLSSCSLVPRALPNLGTRLTPDQTDGRSRVTLHTYVDAQVRVYPH